MFQRNEIITYFVRGSDFLCVAHTHTHARIDIDDNRISRAFKHFIKFSLIFFRLSVDRHKHTDLPM